MARLNVTYGAARLGVVYPAVAASLAKLLGADLSGAFAFSPDALQEHLLDGAFSAGADFGGGLTSSLELAVLLSATGTIDADVQTTFGMAASLDASGDLALRLEQTHLFGLDIFASSFGTAFDIRLTFDLSAVLDGTSDLAPGLEQTNHLAATLAGSGALAGDLEEPAVTNDAFKVALVTYAGDGSGQSITGVGFEPEAVWIMDRTGTGGDVERWLTGKAENGGQQMFGPNGYDGDWGAQTVRDAFYPVFGSDGTAWPPITLDADGFTVNDDDKINASGTDYLAICFKGGVSPETQNFEVLVHSNSSGDNTLSHNLGTAPVWAFNKFESQIEGVWIDGFTLGGQHAVGIGSAPVSETEAVKAVSATDITIGTNNIHWNDGAGTFPLYLFGGDEAAGFYKSGTYTGTGGSGNAITGLGFAPSLVIIRNTDGSGCSVLADELSPLTALELNTGDRDAAFTLDADGFTVNGTGAINASGDTFRYFAWV